MQNQIQINENVINYTFKKSRRAQRLRLTIKPPGILEVTLPLGLSEFYAQKFVQEKKDWILKKINHFKKFNDGALLRKTLKDYSKYKEKARRFITSRVNHFNQIYNSRFRGISIRDQKTRWGSCSVKKNLSFNYKIIFLPQNLADYIIVHELCHLKEMNHSSRFWDLVSKTAPRYKELRRELSQKGLHLQ